MTATNKKIAIYTGGALVLGAVAFFVYSFFNQKQINIGSTTVALGDDLPSNLNDDEQSKGTIINPKTNVFTKMLEQDFGVIKKPSLATGNFV